MFAIFITICALVILLGFEVRHRETAEALNELKSLINRLDDDIVRLKEEMKKKKNVYEEYKPPA
jgi:type VI protein secretion system component VasF